MGLPRRTFFACLASIVVAYGCGPAVKMVSGPSPGVSAPSYLTANTPAMVIEITPTSGHHPAPEAIDILMQRASEHCNKPGGITLQLDDEVPTTPIEGGKAWTYGELSAFEQQYCRSKRDAGTAVLYISYLDGGYGPNPAAIAISYTDHSIAVFKDMLGPGGPEGPALVHELGHQLGLVNGGTRMQAPHEDSLHPMHDLSPSCVMFFSLDPHGDASTPNDYCQHCKDDLKAAGGK